MSRLTSLLGMLKDPPPTHVFEVSEAGIAVAEVGRQPRIGFAALERDVVSVSPVRDNVLRPEALLQQVRAAARGDGVRKRRRAALILPDYAVRVTVLDFEDFPADAKEQASLVRFRLKRSVPFDVDSSAVGFQPQRDSAGGKRVDVVAAIAPLEILARYEAPFRLAGFHVGWVTTSTLAALELVPAAGLNVLAKLTGRVLSLAVVHHGVLKLVRSIELSGFTGEEVVGHLFPTLAYAEDQLSASPGSLLVCGLASATHESGVWLESQLGVRTAALSSRFGQPGPMNAGLMGYLEKLKEI
ncbi:MAG: hypothetical protein IT159_09835 [Bryobacterales bacterium]|nr:hypothetical protein [Bryobacterales bacterium]